MIVSKPIKGKSKDFVQTYSDAGMMIERDGVHYSEAVDPAEFDRRYNETDIPIE